MTTPIRKSKKSSADNKRLLTRIREERADLSSYLWHFVQDDTPSNTLHKILESGVLEGGIYPPCQGHTVCFSEAPLSVCLKQSVMFKEEGYPYMSHYGIGFTKRWLFHKGALPVIYQPRDFYSLLPKELEWRHVNLFLSPSQAGNDFDYTWQREWRVPAQALEITIKDAIIVVPDISEFENVLWEHDFDSEIDDGVVSYSYAGQNPLWSFIAANEVDMTQLSDADIAVHQLSF